LAQIYETNGATKSTKHSGAKISKAELALSGGTRRSWQRYAMKIEFEDKFQGTLVSPETLATERGDGGEGIYKFRSRWYSRG
jgi:hypothetical protein